MGIGLNCRKILLTLALIKVASSAFAQIYVSPKVCVAKDPGTAPPTGTPPATPPPTEMQCDIPTYFFDMNLSPATSWRWDVNGKQIASERRAQHYFTSPGTYNVTLTRMGGSGPSSSSTTVTVGTFPTQPQFNKKNSTDTTVCDGSTITLNPYKGALGGGNYDFLWFPGGETTPTIDVDKSGCYSVEVFDKVTKCSRTAKINVKFCLQDPESAGGSEKWYFGNGAVLDFSLTTTPVVDDPLDHEGPVVPEEPETEDPVYSPLPSTQTHPMNVEQGVGMVYGPDGSLKFYSDGRTVYAGEDDSVIGSITGSSTINTSPSTSQGVAIIPKSSCNECPHHQYYLFTVNPDTKLLSYSVLDMRYNGKKGALTEINVPVMYPVTDRITAIQNSSQDGFVIAAHEEGSDLFTLINVDSTGLRFVNSNVGTVQNTPELRKGYFVLEDGKTKAAQGLVEGGKNYIELYDVDLANLTLSNPVKIDLGIPAPPEVYGVAFAPNGNILYATISGSGSEPSYLIQISLLDPTPAAIQASVKIIHQSTSDTYGAIQTGPVTSPGAKYMYVAVKGKPTILYIQRPDQIGDAAAIGFNPNIGTDLAGNSQLGFPTVTAANQIQEGQALTATFKGDCFKSPTILSTQGACDPLRNKIVWEFEDGTTQEGKEVSYTFPKVGENKFKIRITIYNQSPLQKVIKSQIINKALETECKEKIIDASINILPAPNYTLPDEAYVCVLEGAKYIAKPAIVKLEKDEIISEYLWKTPVGTTLGRNAELEIRAPGTFKVDVTNNFDCMVPDEILIKEGCEPRVFVPDAFTPNDDGINDNLEIKRAWITDYELKVFNRWGEVIFSTDTDYKWDGKVKGRVFAPMVYPYIIYYKSTYFPERGVLTKKGAVTVLN